MMKIYQDSEAHSWVSVPHWLFELADVAGVDGTDSGWNPCGHLSGSGDLDSWWFELIKPSSFPAFYTHLQNNGKKREFIRMENTNSKCVSWIDDGLFVFINIHYFNAPTLSLHVTASQGGMPNFTHSTLPKYVRHRCFFTIKSLFWSFGGSGEEKTTN